MHRKIILLITCFAILNLCSAQCVFQKKEIKIVKKYTISSSNLFSKKEILNLDIFKHINLVCRNEYFNITNKLKDSIKCKVLVDRVNIVSERSNYICELITITDLDSELYSILNEFKSIVFFDCLNGEYKTLDGYIFIPTLSKREIRFVKLTNKSQKSIYSFFK